jgi:hypothetical protein
MSMEDPFETIPDVPSPVPEIPIAAPSESRPKRFRTAKIWYILPIITMLAGLGSGYLIWAPKSAEMEAMHPTAIREQVNPQNGYPIQAKYRNVGPQLVAAGVIDEAQFIRLYQQAGKPLTPDQTQILQQDADQPVVITQQNAYFLLNFFWALGLANQNPLLTTGPLQQRSGGQIEGFASTGGWTIGKKSVKELYAAFPILSLTASQQSNLEAAAKAVFRPCCDNPTDFPDCNHGMAMLGLFEHMASQNASVPDMLAAAKYVNAFWFPDQTYEEAVFIKNTQGKDFKTVDAALVVGQAVSSQSGYSRVHQWLATNGLPDQSPNSGSSCGV